MDWFPKYNVILASKSPRRQQLLQSLGISFKVRVKEVNENYPDGMHKYEIPVFLAELKALPFAADLKKRDLLITADTIVWFEGDVLGKPVDANEAKRMLRKLSGKEHEVISGVCITSLKNKKSFYSVSKVQFKPLTNQEINYYITEFQPFDKAGAYGIQEWIGAVGVTKIEGSYHNVMGLPIQKLYEEIQKF